MRLYVILIDNVMMLVGWVSSENQSSRDTGEPGIEAGFPLVFHWANISTPIPA